MAAEHRFVLTDCIHVDDADRRHVHEERRSYPMLPAVAHAAAKRDFAAHHEPANWTAPSVPTPPEARSEQEVVAAAAEFEALERHAVEPLRPAPTE